MKTSNSKKKATSRVLVIGDIHAPFNLPGYLKHCKDTYKKYNCDTVVFIGDIVDNHYSSYHEADPNGYGGGEELKRAIDEVRQWYKAFPEAHVTTGNHDRIIARKAFSSQVPKEWLKSYNDVLGTPKWKWVERVVIDDVQYVHGEGGSARTKAKNDMQSTVQGHIHTQAYVEWSVGRNFKVFGMQIGCGVDGDSYAAAYAKNFKKQAIGCGVVLEGKVAINELMDL